MTDNIPFLREAEVQPTIGKQNMETLVSLSKYIVVLLIH
jgi:hypothetical protein